MPKKIIDIEASSSDDSTDNDSIKEESEPERLTKSIKKTVLDKPKKVLSDKQKAVLENIATAKTNKKIEAAKLLIEQDTNLKLKEQHDEEKPKKSKSKTKTIIIQSESESSSDEEIVIKKKRSKKPKQESESEEEVKEEQKPTKQRQLKAQISTNKLNKHNIFDGFV